MAAQGERELGDIVMGEGLLDPVAQDIPEQEMLVVGELELPPQMDPEPEMGAAAAGAAVYDTSPPHLHQIPSPAPSKTATDNGGSVQLSPFIMAQMMEMITQAMRGETQQMGKEMREEIKKQRNEMRDEMKKMRGEMRQVGRCLQADKMAPPHATTSELKGSALAGEDRVIRETCRVTETVTREKLNGVTETCTAGRQVTELTETREVEVETN